ncbi:MAG: hypothetical protein EAZ62_04430, partial [Sphingobacteriia bacterium]
MVNPIRLAFNAAFTAEKYAGYLADLNAHFPGAIEFRVAETPIFIDKAFKDKMLAACESIVDVIMAPGFDKLTNRALLHEWKVPREDAHTQFIAFDFGICQNAAGELEPQLIEMQGFPTLFGYQILHEAITRKHFSIPDNYSAYFEPWQAENYTELLRQIIVGDHQPEEVVLLEIFPHQQKTRIDFYCTAKALGIPIVCLSQLEQEGKDLYYVENEKRKKIKRIYNRVIFDELSQSKDPVIQAKAHLFQADLNIEWVPHPHWFYRISKFTLPFIQHAYVPQTTFLHEAQPWPKDLDNYVLKPLFSFAGQGVIIDVKREDLEKISDPENWILQKKVQYADVIQTPDGPAKAELRIFYFWPPNAPRPFPVFNLARLSKGKMIGVRYNQD